MTRIDPNTTNPASQPLLDGVKRSLGVVPKMFQVFAHSAPALKGYLDLNGALSSGKLSPALREQIALVVAEVNGCTYCLSAHLFLGKKAGLDAQSLALSRQAVSPVPHTAAVLKLAQLLVIHRGKPGEEALRAVRAAGVTDEEIVEIVAHVALNTLTNYVNSLAQTEIDFPVAPPLEMITPSSAGHHVSL